MKIFGIVLLVFAALNLIVFLVAAGSGNAAAAGTNLNAFFMLGAIGAYFVWRSHKKKQEADEKEKWQKGE